MPPALYKHILNNNMTVTEDGEYVSLLQWIQQQIDKSPDKTIRMKIIDIKKLLVQNSKIKEIMLYGKV